MWSIVKGTRADLSVNLYEALGRYRFEVFVQRLGWPLRDCEAGREQDEFDTSDAVYVVAVSDQGGDVCGCARLLPTTRPYLLSQVFPNLVDGPLPSSPFVWELSRFAALPTNSAWARGSRLQRDVFRAALFEARARGAQQVVGVVSPAIVRVCRGFGTDLVRMGPLQLTRGCRVLACAVDVSVGEYGSSQRLADAPSPALERHPV